MGGHSILSIICNEYFHENDDCLVTIFLFRFSIFYAHEFYMFSLLLKELYVNFEYLIICVKWACQDFSTIMENFNYMHIVMVSVCYFVIN